MTETNPTDQATDQPTNAATDQPTTPAPPNEPRTPWQQRVLGVRGIATVALAGVLLGGLGGTAIGAAAAGDEHRGSDRFSGVQDRDGRPQQPPRDGLPPATAPQDDSQNS
jgi:hypothetical protein